VGGGGCHGEANGGWVRPGSRQVASVDPVGTDWLGLPGAGSAGGSAVNPGQGPRGLVAGPGRRHPRPGGWHGLHTFDFARFQEVINRLGRARWAQVLGSRLFFFLELEKKKDAGRRVFPPAGFSSPPLPPKQPDAVRSRTAPPRVRQRWVRRRALGRTSSGHLLDHAPIPDLQRAKRGRPSPA